MGLFDGDDEDDDFLDELDDYEYMNKMGIYEDRDNDVPKPVSDFWAGFIILAGFVAFIMVIIAFVADIKITDSFTLVVVIILFILYAIGRKS